jgi:hypothetical protein
MRFDVNKLVIGVVARILVARGGIVFFISADACERMIRAAPKAGRLATARTAPPAPPDALDAVP